MKKTSINAYQSITEQHKSETYKKIIAALKKMPDGGNSWEISKVAKIPYETAWRRVPELVKSGLVKDTNKERPTYSGRNAVVRILTNKGKKMAA